MRYSALHFPDYATCLTAKLPEPKKNRTDDEKSFGIQIDSLCDIVCFGIFPIILGYKLGMCRIYSLVILSFYGVAGVIRLAYFNVMEAKRQSETSENRKYYQGLPITSMVRDHAASVCGFLCSSRDSDIFLLSSYSNASCRLSLYFCFVSESRQIRNWLFLYQLWEWQFFLFCFIRKAGGQNTAFAYVD